MPNVGEDGVKLHSSLRISCSSSILRLGRKVAKKAKQALREEKKRSACVRKGQRRECFKKEGGLLGQRILRGQIR